MPTLSVIEIRDKTSNQRQVFEVTLIINQDEILMLLKPLPTLSETKQLIYFLKIDFFRSV